MAYEPIKSRPAEYDRKRPSALVEGLGELIASVSEQRSNSAVENSPSEHYPEHVLIIGEDQRRGTRCIIVDVNEFEVRPWSSGFLARSGVH